MNLYKLTVKPISSYSSPLQSDTFFGAFCWSYLYGYGESALHRLICNYKNGNPDIIFSNAFPTGRLPLPIGICDKMRGKKRADEKQERYQDYIEEKDLKRISTVSTDDFNRIINGDKRLSLNKNILEPKTKFVTEWRNIVNREKDVVENVDGASSLFETEQYYTESGYDIFVYTSFDRRVLKNVLSEMFYNGIGAQRSVGKGAFQITSEAEPFDGLQIPPDPDGFVALSNFIPQENDPVDGCYKAFVKYPKLSFVGSENDSPFKKPIIFLQAGSVFRDQPVRKFYGSCIENIALKNGNISEEIIVGAYTIAVPCRL